MNMGASYHEPTAEHSTQTREGYRAITSLVEELEAVDCYHQRTDVTGDENLQAIPVHNHDEKIEHAAMKLEWLRRRIAKFDEELRTYLFTSAPITQIEEVPEEPSEQAGPEAPPAADSGIGKPRQ